MVFGNLLRKNGETDGKVWSSAFGYIGLIRETYDNGFTKEEYFCMSLWGRVRHPNAEEFRTECDKKGVFLRGEDAFFSSQEELLDALRTMNWTKWNGLNKVELVKIVKVAYHELAAFEDVSGIAPSAQWGGFDGGNRTK